MSNGASGSGLSDWITAAATAATALFAAITGWAAMQAYRREVKPDFPVVKSDSKWSIEGEIGPHIIIRFTILNRLDETLVVQECTIEKPKMVAISDGIISSGGMLVPSRGVGQRIRLNYNVHRSETFSFALFLSPPEDWHHGEIVAGRTRYAKKERKKHAVMTLVDREGESVRSYRQCQGQNASRKDCHDC